MPAPNESHTVKVVLAEGSKLLREGLRALLEQCGGGEMRIVGEAADSTGALKLVRALSVDVLVLSVVAPHNGSATVIRTIARSFPHLGIVALSMDSSRHHAHLLLDAGAHACLAKESAATELVEAIRLATPRRAYLSTRLVDMVLRGGDGNRAGGNASAADADLGADGATREPPRERPLAPREREILSRIASGESTKEIARALGVGTKTVETHRRRLMHKLNRHTVAELTKYAVIEGLTRLESASSPPSSRA
jgi:two-component system NarL family response regulator